MTAWGLRAGGGVAAVLVMVIFAELTLLDVGGAVPSLAPLDVAPAQDAAAFFPANAGETILNRPLFVRGRRLRGGDMAKAVDDTLPRLTGIIVAPGRNVAVFQADGEKSQALTEGDSIGSWIIQKIDHRQVMMQKSGGTMTIVPAKDITRTAAPVDVVPQGNPVPGATRRPVPTAPGAPIPPGMAARP